MRAFADISLVVCGLCVTLTAAAQAYTQPECVAYALQRAPALRAARLDDSLAALDNAINLSAWRPQVVVGGNAQHFFKRPVSIFPDFENPGSGITREVEIGTINSSVATATASQLLYSPEVLRDLRLRDLRREAARLRVETVEVDVREAVSRAFFQALRAQEAEALATADIERIERRLRDARLLFEEGLNDKVDYKRASIALNSARARRANAALSAEAGRVRLRAAMGYPQDDSLQLSYDYEQYASAIVADSTTTPLGIERRVELRQVDAESAIQQQVTDYQRRAWMPSVDAQVVGAANWFSDDLDALYGKNFPTALARINVSMPLYLGGRRLREVERSTIVEAQLGLDALDLRTRFGAEVTVAQTEFSAARNSFLAATENVALAEEIYNVVELQYREGIAPFLDVVIAENDLQVARNSRLDNLVSAMLARVEVLRAAGLLNADDN